MATQSAARVPVPAMTARRRRCRGLRPSERTSCAPARLRTALRRSAVAAALAALATLLVWAVGVDAGGASARAQDLPRFVSLKAEVANLRVGPGRRYPIDWVYKRRGLPLLVVQHFDQWRWVRDHEGTKGWMHQSLLSTRRTALVTGGVQTIRERPLPKAPAILRAEAGVVADLLGCEDGWCRIALDGEEGWVPENGLWGAALPPP